MRRFGPWVITIAAVGWLLVQYSPSAIAEEMARGWFWAMVPWIAAGLFITLPMMSLADFVVFRPALGAAGARVSWWDLTRARAGSTILTTLGYAVSTGGYGVWLARRARVGAGTTVGAIFYQLIADTTAVSCMALGAALVGGEYLPGPARTPILVAAGIAVAVLSGLALAGPRALPRKWREKPIFAAWGAIGVVPWAVSLALRIATMLTNMMCTWAAARAFGLDIPLVAMAAGFPVVQFVAALPINVAGLGAVQGAWVAIFAGFASGPRILAFQFLFQAIFMATLVVRGLPFLPGVLRDLEGSDVAEPEPASRAPEAEASSPG